MTASASAWLAELEGSAPDTVACWRAIDGSFSGLKQLRRELRARIRSSATFAAATGCCSSACMT